jgi:hypothetical protein
MANFLFSNFKKWLKKLPENHPKIHDFFHFLKKNKNNHQVAKFRHNFIFLKTLV